MIHHEPARDIPVVEETDVLVAGAGPAGVAAAVSAGRSGARVRLIEVHGCLGGVWTAGALSWILDASNKPGLMREIIEELARRGAGQNPQWGGRAYDVEAMKLLLEEKCAQANVGVQLHTRICAAGRDGNNRLAVALTESKSGRQAWAAKCFIDATGDGDLAAQAQCGFDMGRPGTGMTQPMSLMCLMAGIDFKQIEPFVHTNGPDKAYRNDSKLIMKELAKVGVEPSYHAPIIIRIHDNLFAMMANHQYEVKATSAADLTRATLAARAEVNRIVDGLRKLGGAWKDVCLVSTAEQIGVREGRRIDGRYRITADDLIKGARFEDAICRCTFPVDVHATDPDKSKSFDTEAVKAKAYDIPLRALIARDVDGLMMAGRCISGDFVAHSSYRVTGNAVAMGQAAGVTAALAVKQDKLPHQVAWDDVKAALVKMNRGPILDEDGPARAGPGKAP